MIVSVFIVTFELCIVLEITRFALSDRHAIQDIVVIYCDAAGGEAFEVMGNVQQKDFFLCLLLCCGGSRLYVQGLSEEPRRIAAETGCMSREIFARKYCPPYGGAKADRR